MIQKIVGAVVCVLIGALLTLYLTSRHFIRTDDELLIEPKAHLAVEHTYVDIRGWEDEDFAENPAITNALMEGGHDRFVPTLIKLKQEIGEAAKDAGEAARQAAEDLLEKARQQTESGGSETSSSQ